MFQRNGDDVISRLLNPTRGRGILTKRLTTLLNTLIEEFLVFGSFLLAPSPHHQSPAASSLSSHSGGEWTRHNDRACKGRNGILKRAPDWELWTTYPSSSLSLRGVLFLTFGTHDDSEKFIISLRLNKVVQQSKGDTNPNAIWTQGESWIQQDEKL